MKLKEKLWLWGQTAGSHHACGNPFNLPGENRMTPAEGAKFFGISNVFRVVMANMPKPPFDKEAEELKGIKKVLWSVIGSGGSEHKIVVDEVLRLAKLHKNIAGGITDDFLTYERMKLFTPEMISDCREKLHSFEDRKLELYTVVYVRELTEERRKYLEKFDAYTMWTWNGSDLYNLDENYGKLRELVGDEKKILAGCYLWDYGDCKPLADELMEYQLGKYYEWLEDGKIEGVIICSNCIADLGLKTTQMMKSWVEKYGDKVIGTPVLV